MAAPITLSQGKVALVDDSDFASLSQHRWYAMETNGIWYAARKSTKGEGKRTTVLMHRQVLNPHRPYEVDHINHDGLDNRRNNLRLCRHSQNMANQRCSRGSSRYKGVFWEKGKRRWRSEIKVNQRSRTIGRFSDEVSAALAYDLAAIETFGLFAHPNFLVP